MWLLWKMLSARLGHAAHAGKQGFSFATNSVRKGLNLNEKVCQIRGDIRKLKDFHDTLSSFYRFSLSTFFAKLRTCWQKVR